MTPLSKIVQAIRKHPGGTEAVATAAGVPLNTLIKIANGATTSPRYETFVKLHDWHQRLRRKATAR